jgi:4-amino-4-deoxy-L-arabinose transferase-like glycosyltransferase
VTGRAFWLVLAAAIGLRLVFFTGIILFDDVYYLERARQLAAGDFSLPRSYFESRLGTVLPAALAYRLLGVTPLASAAFAFACSIGSVIVAYALGRRLFDERTGLLAALLFAFFPLDVLGATGLMPHTPQAFFTGAAVGAFLLADRERRPALHLVAGLGFGAAALIHESTLMCLAFYPVYALAVARPWRGHLLAAAGLAAALALDPLIHGAMGDPWVHLRRLNLLHTGAERIDTAWKGFNVRWLGEPILRYFTEQELGLYPLLVFPLAVWRLFRARGPAERGAAAFVVIAGLWMLYGSTSPIAYAPMTRLPRYLAPLAVPGCWLLGHQLAARRRPWVVLALVLLSSVACLLADGGRGQLVRFEVARDALLRQRPARVVTEPGWSEGLKIVTRFEAPYAIEDLAAGTDLAGAYVVAASDATRARLGDTEIVATVTPPRTVYQELLANRFVMAILRATRPPYRVADLEKKAVPPVITIHRAR